MSEKKFRSLEEQLANPGRSMYRGESSSLRKDYSRELDIGIGSFLVNSEEDVDKRPKAVFRWAFDDYAVEDLWLEKADATHSEPDKDSATDRACTSGAPQLGFVDVTTEGMDDVDLMKHLKSKALKHASSQREDSEQRQLLLNQTHWTLSSPVDFVSSAIRRVFLPDTEATRSAFSERQVISDSRNGSSALHVSRFERKCDHTAVIPRHPDARRYTLTFRGVDAKSTSIHDMLSRCKKLASTGVINYAPNVRHGYHLSRAFQSGLDILNGRYRDFLFRHLYEMTEGSAQVQRDVNQLCEHMQSFHNASNAKVERVAFAHFERSIEYHKSLQAVLRQPATGIYARHLDMLQDFAVRVGAMRPQEQLNTAKLIRETISRQVIRDKLRALTDVHFNALATLRMQMLGPNVHVGDLVVCVSKPCSDDRLLSWRSQLDPFTTKHDHLYQLGEEQLYASAEPEGCQDVCIKAVESEEEAKCYSIEDIVLPLFGGGSEKKSLMFPLHRCGASMSNELAVKLQIASLSTMNLAPRVGYRPLIVKPKNLKMLIFDDDRNMTWGVSEGELKSSFQLDVEGVRRYVAPCFRGRNPVVARAGVAPREKFLALATRCGLHTCTIQFDLPYGASPTSVVRELFKTRTLDPASVLQMIPSALKSKTTLRHRRGR